MLVYRKSRIFSDIENVYCNHPKIQVNRLLHREISTKQVNGMSNIVDLIRLLL